METRTSFGWTGGCDAEGGKVFGEMFWVVCGTKSQGGSRSGGREVVGGWRRAAEQSGKLVDSSRPFRYTDRKRSAVRKRKIHLTL